MHCTVCRLNLAFREITPPSLTPFVISTLLLLVFYLQAEDSVWHLVVTSKLLQSRRNQSAICSLITGPIKKHPAMCLSSIYVADQSHVTLQLPANMSPTTAERLGVPWLMSCWSCQAGQYHYERPISYRKSPEFSSRAQKGNLERAQCSKSGN